MLPSFLLIGAAKSGTTALHAYLGQHPEIFMCPRKDPGFFAHAPGAGASGPHDDSPGFQIPIQDLESYEELFRSARGERAVGETSTIYLESSVAARRIHELVPRAKLIAILRNPVDRAYSGYIMRVRAGWEKAGVSEALGENSHYVRVGRYAHFLKRYYDVFNRSQLRVHLFEDFRKDPAAVYRDLVRFLGVDETFAPDLGLPRNVGGLPRNRLLHALYSNRLLRTSLLPLVPSGLRRWGTRLRNRNMAKADPLPPELRSRLVDIYRDDVHRLEDLLDRDLEGWLEGSLPARRGQAGRGRRQESGERSPSPRKESHSGS